MTDALDGGRRSSLSDEKPTETTPPAAPPTPKGPPSVLTKPTDLAPKPGFRAPSNNRSKAQKKKK